MGDRACPPPPEDHRAYCRVKRRLVIIRPEAEADTEDAALWYEAQRVGLGLDFDEDLDHLLQRIRENALQFPEIEPEVRRGLLNRFPYAVYFVVENEMVAIVAVLHQRRRPGAWRDRLG